MFSQLRKLIPPTHPVRLFWHKCKAMVAATVFRFPGKHLTVIGITGTDGKTTTVTLTAKILEKAGYKIGVASTTFLKVGNREWQNTSHKTSLTPFGMQRLLRQMVKAGCTHAVIEVSSHGLSQSRLWGVPFSVAGITNITPEHLDYHVSMKNYRADKYKLFRSLHAGMKVGVINLDDVDTAADLLSIKGFSTLGYSRNGAKLGTADESLIADNIEYSSDLTNLTLITSEDSRRLAYFLPGSYNVENLLCATGIATSLGSTLKDVENACQEIRGIPGRFEEINEGQNFKVIVDFAMTEDGYTRLLKMMRKMADKKVWVVFGCCGDRDQYKRRGIGEVCAKNADYVVVTDDEPYTEDAGDIRQMIIEGLVNLTEGEQYWEIPDRRGAMLHAFERAEEGDVVLIPGMGDLEGRTFADKVMEWSDRDVARELLGDITIARSKANDKIMRAPPEN
jgi:UDP-N-acetylmuramoyl-L-alanyl-D-glutamate--2,6-diaminopimelate ligase